MYVLSLAATIGLLVVWIVYVVRSGARLMEVARRAGVPGQGFPWIILTVGCVLFFFLIVGLTYQLAQTFAARRYAQKQDEFLANVTHELKSPLAAIKLHAQTLRQIPDLSSQERERFLGTIDEQADRMSTLVDEVLESSRLVSRKRSLRLEPVALGAFLEEYLRAAAHRARTHGLLLTSDLRLEGKVLGTAEALRRVLDNLIENAIRFSEPGGEIRFTAEIEGTQALIVVEDDGIGVPRKELNRIFDRFYQAGQPQDVRRRGTGLGLAIVAGLVAEMRGSVEAVSPHEGKVGTRFAVRLPLYREGKESS
jgi:signal transduction histidine kinase